MIKTHTLYTTIINYENIQYFYTRDKNDRNGNPRFRVYIIDPDWVVYETIIKCYEFEIGKKIKELFEKDEY